MMGAAEPLTFSYKAGPFAGKTLKGIYKIDGDALTVCYPSPKLQETEKLERPKEFDTKKSKDLVLLMFQRKTQ